MPLLSSAPRIVRVALNPGSTERTVALPRPVAKILIRTLPTNFEAGITEGQLRYAFVSGQCADGGNYTPVKFGEVKAVDETGPTPPTLFLREGVAAKNDTVAIVEIWE